MGDHSKPRVMKLSRKTLTEPSPGTTVGTQIGSAGVKGTDDGGRAGDVGRVTVVGWRDDRFHKLH